MVQIFPYSLLGLFTNLYIKWHLFFKMHRIDIKTSLHYHPYKSDTPTVYFIIKSRALTTEKMYSILKDIRERSTLAQIIIVGKNIDYEELYRNHYRILSVIDRTENQPLSYIRKEIANILDSLYPR